MSAPLTAIRRGESHSSGKQKKKMRSVEGGVAAWITTGENKLAPGALWRDPAGDQYQQYTSNVTSTRHQLDGYNTKELRNIRVVVQFFSSDNRSPVNFARP
ncbi:MAG: hypothetical protein AAFP90_18320 [Planctomycetota bacterium]